MNTTQTRSNVDPTHNRTTFARLTTFATLAFIASACGSSLYTSEVPDSGPTQSGAVETASIRVEASAPIHDASAEDEAPAEAGTASSGSSILDAQWSDNVTVTVNGDTLNITSDGIPNHDYPDQWAAPADPINISAENAMIVGDVVSAQNYDYDIPANPVYSETPTDTPMGLIGIAISGAAIFNPYEAGGSYAIDASFEVDGVEFIDSCHGHPQGQGAYHYHAVPHCITDQINTEGEHSEIIGVALDGFAIYGEEGQDGEAPTDLDECSGHTEATSETSESSYHYHMTDTAPYSLVCFHGEYDASQTSSPATGDRPGSGPDRSDRPQGPPPRQGNGGS